LISLAIFAEAGEKGRIGHFLWAILLDEVCFGRFNQFLFVLGGRVHGVHPFFLDSLT